LGRDWGPGTKDEGRGVDYSSATTPYASSTARLIPSKVKDNAQVWPTSDSATGATQSRFILTTTIRLSGSMAVFVSQSIQPFVPAFVPTTQRNAVPAFSFPE